MSFRSIGRDMRMSPQDKTFIGEVIDNNDPLQLGRCRIRVIELHGTKTDDTLLPWAIPFMSVGWGAAPNIGSLIIPRLASKVYYKLINNDIYSPQFHSVPVSTPDAITDLAADYPDRYGFVDPAGNKVEISLVDNSVKFTLANGCILDIDTDGVLDLTLPDAWTITSTGDGVIDVGTVLDLLGNLDVTGSIDASVDMTAVGDVSDSNGNNPTMANLRAVFDAHVHIGSPTAPTGGITPTGIPTTLMGPPA